jgi:hypothetical protein
MPWVPSMAAFIVPQAPRSRVVATIIKYFIVVPYVRAFRA